MRLSVQKVLRLSVQKVLISNTTRRNNRTEIKVSETSQTDLSESFVFFCSERREVTQVYTLTKNIVYRINLLLRIPRFIKSSNLLLTYYIIIGEHTNLDITNTVNNRLGPVKVRTLPLDYY